MRPLLFLMLGFLVISGHTQVVVMSSIYSPFQPPESLPTPDGGYIGITKTYNVKKGTGWNRLRYVISLTKFDARLNTIKTTSLYNGEPAFTAFYVALKKSNDKYWLVYIEPSKGFNLGSVKAVEINTNTLETGETITLAAESQVSMKINVSSPSKIKIYFESSPDYKNHCLFLYSGEAEYYVSEFDENLKTLWSGRMTSPGYKPEDMRSIYITNSGEIFLANIKNEKTAVTIFKKNGSVSHKDLSFPNIHPTDLKIYGLDEKNDVLIRGHYGHGSETVTGVYKASLNSRTTAIENLVSEDFPEVTIERLKKDGFAKTKSKNFGIEEESLSCEVFKRKNGELVLILECKHYLGVNVRMGTGVGSLLTASFTSSGPRFSHIPRYAVTPEVIEGRNEYFAVGCKDDLILFYKDEASNLNISLDQPQKVLNGDKNAILVGAYVASDGKISKRVMVSSSGSQITENINRYLMKECQTP